MESGQHWPTCNGNDKWTDPALDTAMDVNREQKAKTYFDAFKARKNAFWILKKYLVWKYLLRHVYLIASINK